MTPLSIHWVCTTWYQSQTFICMNEPKSSEDSHVSFRFFPGWSCNLPRPFFPKKNFTRKNPVYFTFHLFVCIYYTYIIYVQKRTKYIVLFIISHCYHAVLIHIYYWTSRHGVLSSWRSILYRSSLLTWFSRLEKRSNFIFHFYSQFTIHLH